MFAEYKIHKVVEKLLLRTNRTNFTALIKPLYERYFDFPVIQQDKMWIPHICHATYGWARKSLSLLEFL